MSLIKQFIGVYHFIQELKMYGFILKMLYYSPFSLRFLLESNKECWVASMLIIMIEGVDWFVSLHQLSQK